MLLGLIAEQPRHGYELIKAIEEQFGGLYSPSPGVVYPTLTLLEELGYIRPESTEGPRKQFVVTPEGSAFLAANQAVVDQIFARMAEVTRPVGGGPAPEIQRAMHNLETALTIRLGRGPLDAGAGSRGDHGARPRRRRNRAELTSDVSRRRRALGLSLALGPRFAGRRYEITPPLSAPASPRRSRAAKRSSASSISAGVMHSGGENEIAST